MSGVLILIAALSSFHSNKYQCVKVAESLITMAVYESINGDKISLDKDLAAIKKFNTRCQSK